jgi:hypothetical protein
MMSLTITIDKKLISESTNSEAIQTLKRWQTEGKLELVDTEPKEKFQAETKAWFTVNNVETKNSNFGGPSKRRAPKSAHKINFTQVAGVLFPHRDSKRLDMSEINDVAHIIIHHTSGNKIFVTDNTNTFIVQGRRERLKSSFGVVALTPEETVQWFVEHEGWK